MLYPEYPSLPVSPQWAFMEQPRSEIVHSEIAHSEIAHSEIVQELRFPVSPLARGDRRTGLGQLNYISGSSASASRALDGPPGRIRICDLCLRRAALYPAELRAVETPYPPGGGWMGSEIITGLPGLVHVRRGTSGVERPARSCGTLHRARQSAGRGGQWKVWIPGS